MVHHLDVAQGVCRNHLFARARRHPYLPAADCAQRFERARKFHSEAVIPHGLYHKVENAEFVAVYRILRKIGDYDDEHALVHLAQLFYGAHSVEHGHLYVHKHEVEIGPVLFDEFHTVAEDYGAYFNPVLGGISADVALYHLGYRTVVLDYRYPVHKILFPPAPRCPSRLRRFPPMQFKLYLQKPFLSKPKLWKCIFCRFRCIFWGGAAADGQTAQLRRRKENAPPARKAKKSMRTPQSVRIP